MSLVTAVTFLLTVASFLGPGEGWAVDQSHASDKRAFSSKMTYLAMYNAFST